MVMAALGSDSGLSNGIRIMVMMMATFNANVAMIHQLVSLIRLLDSNVASSNMADLESGVGFSTL